MTCAPIHLTTCSTAGAVPAFWVREIAAAETASHRKRNNVYLPLF